MGYPRPRDYQPTPRPPRPQPGQPRRPLQPYRPPGPKPVRPVPFRPLHNPGQFGKRLPGPLPNPGPLRGPGMRILRGFMRRLPYLLAAEIALEYFLGKEEVPYQAPAFIHVGYTMFNTCGKPGPGPALGRQIGLCDWWSPATAEIGLWPNVSTMPNAFATWEPSQSHPGNYETCWQYLKGSGTQPVPYWQPEVPAQAPIWTWPGITPLEWPWLDPLPMPVFQPQPQTRPLPYRVIPYRQPMPDRSPVEQPQRGPAPQPIIWPQRRRREDPRKQPSFEYPEVIYHPGPAKDPQGKPKPTPRPAQHLRQKPRGRAREKKQMMSLDNASTLGRIISAITESLDFLNAAFKSLDPKITRGKNHAPPQEKLLILMMNLEHLRPGTFLANLLSEQFEDQAFGMLGKNAGKAARKIWEETGARVQYQMGPADTPPRPDTGEDPYIRDLDKWLSEHVYKPALGL